MHPRRPPQSLRTCRTTPHRAIAALFVVGAVTGSPTRLSAADDPSLAAIRRRLEEPDPAARAAAVRRLAGTLDPASIQLVAATLADRHPYVRRAAAGVLGIVLDPTVRARLLKDGPTWKEGIARAELTETFAAWADRDGRTGLLRTAGDRDPVVRAAAARRLGEDPDEAAGRALVLATSDTDGQVRATALDALAARGLVAGAAKVEAPFAASAKDRDPRVRVAALEGSVAMGGEAAVFAVSHGLDDAVWSVRLVAAELAGAVRDRRVLRPLVGAIKDPRERVAQAAAMSLVKLTGIPFDADAERWAAWLAGDGATFDPSSVTPHKAPPLDPGSRTVAVVKFLDLPLVSSHVTFVLDASGSMGERDAAGVSRWDRVRDEVDRVLERLGTSTEGNVVLFSDEAIALFPSAVRFTPAARTKVKETLAARPPAGRTALYDGIAKALEDPTIDDVIVLSDGAPSAGSWFTKTDLRAEVLRANRWRRARIDVIAVGTDAVAKRWRSLLGDLAEATGGRLLLK
jgi:HEAT repeat protein